MSALQKKLINVITLRQMAVCKKNAYIAPSHEILPHLIYNILSTENNGYNLEPFAFMELKDRICEHFQRQLDNGHGYVNIGDIQKAFNLVAELKYSNSLSISPEAFSLHYTQPYLIAAVALFHLEERHVLKEDRLPFMEHLKAAKMLAQQNEKELYEILSSKFKEKAGCLGY